MGAGLRPTAKALAKPPDPTVGAPIPDPTNVVYHPKYMTALQLVDQYWRANRKFYSLPSIIKRLTTNAYSFEMLPLNLFFAWYVRRGSHPLEYF